MSLGYRVIVLLWGVSEMKMNEVLKETGLTKKAVILYIQKGFLCPAQTENGYYDFSDEDILTLKTVRILRELDMPLKSIEAVLKNPNACLYILVNHRNRLIREMKVLNQACSVVSEITDSLQNGKPLISLQNVCNYIYNKHAESSDKNSRRPVNETDADAILLHFFGNYIDDLEWNEYQLYLLKRIKQKILQQQTPELISFRNYLNDLDPDKIANEYLKGEGELFVELKKLSPDSYDIFCKKVIPIIEHNLHNNSWLMEYRQNYVGYLKPSTAYYHGEIGALIGELSPSYKIFTRNTSAISLKLYNYLHSEEGMPLMRLIDSTLGDYIDLECNDHTEIISLFLFP